MNVSIIIPFISDPDMTLRSVESVRCHTQDSEIIIVDNGAVPDEHAAIVRSVTLLPDVAVVRSGTGDSEVRRSFAHGNNFAAVCAKGDYLVFLNNDTEVTCGWLPPLLATLERDDAVVVQPRLTYPDGSIQCAGLAFSPYSILPYHIFKNFPKDHPAVTSSEHLQAVTGACMGIRRIDFESVGGFDEAFVNGCEDVDLCLRLRQKTGRFAWYVPESDVVHHEGRSPGRGDHILANRKLLLHRLYTGAYNAVEPDDGNRCLRHGLLPLDYQTDESNGVPRELVISAPRKYAPHPLLYRRAKVLVVKPSGLGNMIMFLPALRALKQLLLPCSSITVLCYAAEAEVIQKEVTDVLVIPKHPIDSSPDRNMLPSLVSARRFDVVLYPPFTNFVEVPQELAQCSPIHIHHANINYVYKHEVEHNIDLVRQLGWTGKVPPMRVPTPEPAPSKNRNAYITVHVGASTAEHMRKKRWAAPFWASLIEALTKEFDIAFVGTSTDVEDIRSVRVLLSPAADACCREVLGSFFSSTACAETLLHASLHISNDSGLMHLAAAAGVKNLAIFGPTSPSKNRPWGEPGQCRIILPLTDCAPCYVDKGDILLACERQRCLESVTPQRVLLAAMTFLRCAGSEDVAVTSTHEAASCPICGSAKVLPGPFGRSSRNGSLPLCAGCHSLERHRAMFLAYQQLPEYLTEPLHALQFSEDPAAPAAQFASLEISAFNGKNHLDINSISREDESYGWVICNHVLEHVPDPTSAFSELVRIVNHDGVLELCVPDPARLMWTEDWGFPDMARHGHYREFGADMVSLLPCENLFCLTVNTHDPITEDRDIMFLFTKSAFRFQQLCNIYEKKWSKEVSI